MARDQRRRGVDGCRWRLSGPAGELATKSRMKTDEGEEVGSKPNFGFHDSVRFKVGSKPNLKPLQECPFSFYPQPNRIYFLA